MEDPFNQLFICYLFRVLEHFKKLFLFYVMGIDLTF